MKEKTYRFKGFKVHIQPIGDQKKQIFGAQVGLERGHTPVLFLSCGRIMIGFGFNLNTKDTTK